MAWAGRFPSLQLLAIRYISSVLVYTGCTTCAAFHGTYLDGPTSEHRPLLCDFPIITALVPLEARSCPSN